MADLLLELFSEELPAAMQPKAESWLRDNLTKVLAEAKLMHGEIKTYRTPRRIAVTVKDLPEQQPDKTEERKGPATAAPEQALNGFLQSTGLTKDQLQTREIKGKNYYFAVMEEKGKPTAEALKPLLEELISALPWPKSMRWGDNTITWARPLQNICCILDDKTITLQFAHLTANNTTYGHRFLAAEAITIHHPNSYAETLKASYVMADGEEREARIKEELTLTAKAENLELIEDPALLREVTGLVEWPTVLKGRIDDQFMTLPPEVMRSEMHNHQKYFTLLNKDGSAASSFLIISNLIAKDGGKAVTAGNERVLRARLADGQFFYNQDQKLSLDEWNKKLESVVFHAKLGSIADKTRRVQSLAENIAEYVEQADTTDVKRAAALCKADLPTGMVGEFPELQGIMGRYYALAQKEPNAVADAIRDHYLPLGPNSPVPTQPVSIVIALADKLDSLIELFRIGETPTGSKDPFALRRAALGVIRLILENELRLPLKRFVSDENLFSFILDRLRGTLKDDGLRHDVIEAVLNTSEDDDLLRLSRKIRALDNFIQSQDASALLTAYGRAANILAKSDHTASGKVSTELLEQLEEKTLYEAIENTSSAIQTHLAAEAYGEALSRFASLRQPVDAFFDHVTVNADDKQLRHNRLLLLSSLVENMQSIADFSQIQQVA